MKNTFKLFGNLIRANHRLAKVPLVIIALVVVIGFSLSSCVSNYEEGSALIKVVNQSDIVIERVDVGLYFGTSNVSDVGHWLDLNITKGNSQTFTTYVCEFHKDGEEGSIIINWDGSKQKNIRLYVGKTTTVTLNAAGELE